MSASAFNMESLRIEGKIRKDAIELNFEKVANIIRPVSQDIEWIALDYSKRLR